MLYSEDVAATQVTGWEFSFYNLTVPLEKYTWLKVRWAGPLARRSEEPPPHVVQHYLSLHLLSCSSKAADITVRFSQRFLECL